jgi:hypothetical protein
VFLEENTGREVSSSPSRSIGVKRRADKEGYRVMIKVMIRRNVGTILVASALVLLFLLALVLARAQDNLPVLALDLTEHLFGIILAVFVFERVLAWREERRWLAAKKWMYMILLETIDDLLRQLLPAAVPKEEEEESAGEITVYEVTGERVHFGEVVAYGLLRLLVGPDEKDLQSHLLWYARELESPRYTSLAKRALSDAREQIRETFGSSARLMEADITAMLMNFEQAIVVAIGHLDSATSMRDERLEDAPYLDEESARQKIREADHQLAFTTSIVVESVISSAMKPKAWLEDRLHRGGDESPFEYLQASNLTR